MLANFFRKPQIHAPDRGAAASRWETHSGTARGLQEESAGPKAGQAGRRYGAFCAGTGSSGGERQDSIVGQGD